MNTMYPVENGMSLAISKGWLVKRFPCQRD